MQSSFSFRKLYSLCFLLLYALVGIGQDKVMVFDKEWEKAQTYLADEELTFLWKTLADLEQLVPDKQSTQYGKITYLLGEYWYAKEKWAKAKDYLNQTIQLLEKDTSEQLILAEAYLVAGFTAEAMRAENQILPYYQKALALKQHIYGLNHPRVASIYFNIGEAHQTRFDLIQSDAAFQKGMAILDTIYTEENVEVADYYEELGYNRSLMEDFKEAIKYLEKALLLKEKVLEENDPSLVYAYKYLGQTYRNAEYFGEAINYFNKALQIIKEQKERDTYQEAMLYHHIGKSYLELKAYGKAVTYFDKAILTDKANRFIFFNVHRLKGKIASEKGAIKKANNHFKRALKGFDKKEANYEDYLIETYKLIIEHQLKIGNYKEALLNAQNAIQKGAALYKIKPTIFFGLYLLLGKCQYALGNTDRAVASFLKAYTINGGEINREFSNLKQLKNEVTLNLEYVAIYLGKQDFLQDLPTLLKADTLLSTTIELVDYITTTYQEKSTKENFIEEYYSVFKKAIQVKYALYEVTQKEKYLKTAFTLAEKSKNLILLETLNKVDALESAVIPDAIIQEEKSLRIDITYLENRRFEENQQPILDEAIIRDLNGQIFELKNKYQALLKEIELVYPDYFTLKFKSTFASIETIQQNLLTKEQMIIEYFLGDDLIYVFLIKKDTFKVWTIPKGDDLVAKINQFRKSIYTYRPASEIIQRELNDSLVAITNTLGFELYKILLAPFQSELTKKIIIVADGALGYLPFDALIYQAPTKDKQFNQPSYLMTKYLISHAHSINWLNGLLKKETAEFEQNFIGLAPVFKSTNKEKGIVGFRLGLGPLKHNQEEIINIKNSIGGKVIKGAAATRQAFLAFLKQGQILHLATHGKSNDEQGDYSYLAFAKPTEATDNQFLYVKDLFNLKIPADLVVLSACETGLGEIKRGEGIVGIGKGFSYAGAKSMVTTLWRVSDNSTANFMPLFYANLKAGQAKDEALWHAKQQFIEKYRHAGHPFFWSGYVAYGNMSAIEFQHYNWSASLLLSLILISIVLFFLGLYLYGR